jgi:cyanate permease
MPSTKRRSRRVRRVALGLVTSWPLAYVAGWAPQLLELLRYFARRRAGGAALPEPPELGLAIAMYLGTALLVVVLVLGYALHLAGCRLVPEEQKLPWVLLLVLGSVLVLPIYFWLYVWPEPDAEVDPPG